MKRTGPASLVIAAVLGGGAGYLLDELLTSAGRATFTPQISLPILLLALGAIVIALAVPIHRASLGRSGAGAVNPFHAVRIAMLAKASSLLGAVFGGVAVGLIVFLLTRPAEPSIGSLSALIGTAICAVLLMVGALVAEHLCTIRKDDDDKHTGAGSGAGDTDEPRPDDAGGHYGTH